MPDFPTFRDLFRVARDEVLARNSSMTREVVEREGSDANALVAAGVAVGDDNIGDVARVEAGFYVASAVGTTLDKRAWDRYQLVRNAAAPAVVNITFTSTTPAAANGTIPIGFRVATSDGREFKTTAATVYPLGSTGPITVAAQSSLAGANQQVVAGGINSIVDTFTNQPPDLVVTNLLASAGAADGELDDSLQNRCRNFYATARRGTLKAIEQGALAVAGCQSAKAFEPVDYNGYPARIVNLVVADAFTEQLVDASAVPPAYAAQSAAFAATVQAGLNDVRAAGIHVNVILGVVSLLGVTLVLRFDSGVDQVSVALRARNAVVEYVNGLQPGAPFVPADALNALRKVSGLIVTGAEIASPAGVVVPTQLQVLRTYLGLVLINSSGS